MKPHHFWSNAVKFLMFLLIVVTPMNFALSQEREIPDFMHLRNISGVRGGSLAVAVSSDPSNFNRMLASGLSNVAISERLSADLVHINRNTMQLEPSLATGWESDTSGRAYTIHLRRGIRFSNNAPFTADDVLFTFQVLTDPKTACTMAGQIEIDGKFPGIAKIDDHTVRLTFERPVGMGLRILDSVPILSRQALQKAYHEGKVADAWGPAVKPGDVVGLGPFRLKEYQRGVKVVLERNPYYWKKDRSGQTLPYLDSLVFLIIPDVSAQALRLGQGELDLANSLNPENYATLRRSAKGIRLRDLGPGLATDFLWFNLNRNRGKANEAVDAEKQEVFEKSEFRRAISYALDRKGMITSVLLGLGSPQYGPVSSGNMGWYHPGIVRTDYSLSRARELLSKAGLKDTNGDGVLEYGLKRQPFAFTLLTTRGNAVREKLAQIIQDNLGKTGIRVDVQHLLPNELASRFLNTFDYEAMLFVFTPTDVVPDSQTDMWYSSGQLHFWCPNQEKPERAWEATMDALVSSMVRQMDQGMRKSEFVKIQDLWSKEMPAIPTIASNILVGWNDRLGNVLPSVLTPHILWNVETIFKRPR